MAGARVNRPQFFGKIVGDAECFCGRRANVAQNRKGERILLCGRKTLIWSLWRNGDQLRAEARDFRKGLLQCVQCQIAIWAPAAAIKTQDYRACREEVL